MARNGQGHCPSDTLAPCEHASLFLGILALSEKGREFYGRPSVRILGITFHAVYPTRC